MTFPLFVYAYVALIIGTFLCIARDEATRLCAYCKTPGRETMVAVVTAVLWPVLFASFVLGLTWFVVRETFRDIDDSPMGACEHP